LEDPFRLPEPFLLGNLRAFGLAVPETLLDAIHRFSFSLLVAAPFNPQRQRLDRAASTEVPAPKSAFFRSSYATLHFLFS
jgi:hypothetical protein